MFVASGDTGGSFDFWVLVCFLVALPHLNTQLIHALVPLCFNLSDSYTVN